MRSFSSIRISNLDPKSVKKAFEKVLGLNSEKSVGLCIGNFDGMHLGHQELLKKLQSLDVDCRFLVSFYPHPQFYFKKKRGLEQDEKYLSPLRKKTKIAKKHEIDGLVFLRFNDQLARISADEFLNLFFHSVPNLKAVVVGYDWRFGKEREGDVSFLKKKEASLGFKLEVVDQYIVDEQRASTTVLKVLIAESKFEEVERLLGRKFRIMGRVGHGDGRGAEIGFRTANIFCPKQYLPDTGVYITKLQVENTIYHSVTNVGYVPTFKKGLRYPRVETHILDSTPELYGKIVSLAFLKRLRGEIGFSNVSDLKRQIELDVKKAKDYFASNDG